MDGLAGRAKYRSGLGRESLCGGCNGGTGSDYGDAYAAWVQRTLEYASVGRAIDGFPLPYTLRPLEAIKQVATMAIAVNDWANTQSEAFQSLRRLVKNPRMTGYPAGIRFYAFLMVRGDPRLSPVTGRLMVAGVKVITGLAEIAFPPLGFVVLSDGPNEREVARRIGLQDITKFFEMRPNCERAEVLRLRMLVPRGVTILDYEQTTQSPIYVSERGGQRQAASERRRRTIANG